MECKDYQPGKPFPEKMLPYAWKYGNAYEQAIEYFCSEYSQATALQLLTEWNAGGQPILEAAHVTRVVTDCWNEYSKLVIPDESCQGPIFRQLTPKNWKTVAWRELLTYVKNLSLDPDEIERALQEYIPCRSGRTNLKCLLGGYFLLANGEAPVYVIQCLYDLFSAYPIDANAYDAKSYRMRQAIVVHEYVSYCLSDGVTLMTGFGMKSDECLLRLSLTTLHNLYLKLVPMSQISICIVPKLRV